MIPKICWRFFVFLGLCTGLVGVTAASLPTFAYDGSVGLVPHAGLKVRMKQVKTIGDVYPAVEELIAELRPLEGSNLAAILDHRSIGSPGLTVRNSSRNCRES
ncbi:MAG TPA: hypothetical protein VN673_00580 [Clostridia bacterium]|nr:hypothetical protein [Clostridia bacterium]